MTNPNESNDMREALQRYVDDERDYVEDIIRYPKGQFLDAEIIDRHQKAVAALAQASLATPQPQRVLMDTLENCARICEQAKQRAEETYGVAEGVGADMCVRAIRALIEPLSVTDSVTVQEPEMRVYLEHGWVCVRTSTGQLIKGMPLNEISDGGYFTFKANHRGLD